MKCRHCRQTFQPRPDKKGFINECPQCEGQRYTEAPSYGMSYEGAGQWIKAVHGKKRRRKPRPMSAFRRLMREIDLRKRRKKKAKSRRLKAERRRREREARAKGIMIARPVMPTPKVVKSKPPETMTAAEWIRKNNWSPYKRGN